MMSLFKSLNLILLLQLLFQVDLVSAANHALTWAIPMSPRKKDVAPGDTLTFSWGGNHNVYLLGSGECQGSNFYNDIDAFVCPSAGNFGTSVGTSSPATYTVPSGASDGSYLCFACEVSGHCAAKQYITVKVVAPQAQNNAGGGNTNTNTNSNTDDSAAVNNGVRRNFTSYSTVTSVIGLLMAMMCVMVGGIFNFGN